MKKIKDHSFVHSKIYHGVIRITSPKDNCDLIALAGASAVKRSLGGV